MLSNARLTSLLLQQKDDAWLAAISDRVLGRAVSTAAIVGYPFGIKEAHRALCWAADWRQMRI